MATNKTRTRVKKSLTALQEASRELNILDDRLRYQIGEVEKALAALRIGVRFTVSIQAVDEGGYYSDLSYYKGSGGWGLYVEEAVSGDEEHTWRATRLEECARDLRAAVLDKHLVLLLESATKTIAQRVRHRRTALTNSEAVIDELNAVTGGAE